MAMTLDEWVIVSLERLGPLTFRTLFGGTPSGTHARQLDRALQRLRRAGRIRFERKSGWSLVR